MTTTLINPKAGGGYWRKDGQYVDGFVMALLGAMANGVGQASSYGAGAAPGPVIETGAARTLSALLQVTAKSGTNPALDVTIETSPDGVNDWRKVDAFAQKTDAAAIGSYVMTAVTATGTTPPTVTITGTQKVPVNLWVQCTANAGARGTWTGQFSIDGGVTWTQFTSAATVAVIVTDPASGATIDTGLVINIATGNAATDNVWKATTANQERKDFTGLSRFIRAVPVVGGSSTPTMSALLTGSLY